MELEKIQTIIEAALMAYSKPLSVEKLQSLFVDDTLGLKDQLVPDKGTIEAALEAIQMTCDGRGFELKEVSNGWRFQVRDGLATWVNRLWEEKPQRYSRALLETLAIIAYRQPITRGDIEEIRGVAVSSSIIKTLGEREWIKVVGQRDVPGRPSLYATTKEFLDYFNLQSLEQLPTLQDLTDIEALTPELDLGADVIEAINKGEAPTPASEAGDNDAIELNSEEVSEQPVETSEAEGVINTDNNVNPVLNS